MLLRITYSNTKRFFKNTIENFKSYFPRGYQRLHKTPPCNPFSCSGTRSGVIPHTNHSNRHYKVSEKTTNNHTNAAEISQDQTSSIMNHKEPNLIINQNQVDGTKQDNKKKYSEKYEKDDHDHQVESSMCLVTRKLKELEMMDGYNDLDLVLDIEEVLHYYARLTCPVYRDIMDNFFVDLYSRTFNLSGVDNSLVKNDSFKLKGDVIID
ncbi:uncharacterized protein [Rutidosis leptorrhynchoides]|uniref:uncharacterized protein n=1 Tax=Rutidosis leptorrhynchoides TaxID=125765 RepID=UPI003A98DCB4